MTRRSVQVYPDGTWDVQTRPGTSSLGPRPLTTEPHADLGRRRDSTTAMSAIAAPQESSTTRSRGRRSSMDLSTMQQPVQQEQQQQQQQQQPPPQYILQASDSIGSLPMSALAGMPLSASTPFRRWSMNLYGEVACLCSNLLAVCVLACVLLDRSEAAPCAFARPI